MRNRLEKKPKETKKESMENFAKIVLILLRQNPWWVRDTLREYPRSMIELVIKSRKNVWDQRTVKKYMSAFEELDLIDPLPKRIRGKQPSADQTILDQFPSKIQSPKNGKKVGNSTLYDYRKKIFRIKQE